MNGVKVEYRGFKRRLPALVCAMKPGELWLGTLVLGAASRTYLRTMGEESGGLVNVETGKFYSEWTHKELHNARRLAGTLTVEEAA
jgi:hypothetical protein